MNINCWICESRRTIKLNISRKTSLTTDGTILKQQLSKLQCINCGLFFNPNPIAMNNYHRSSGDSKWDIQRHKDIAKNVSNLIEKIFFSKKKISVLEIGGGNYLTSYFLSKINKKLSVTCIEPYPENDAPKSGVDCLKLKLEDYLPKKKFEFIFSNNVIEHTNNPVEYIKNIDKLLSEKSFILVCCPTQTKITNEILFIDHIFHFSEQSFKMIANKAGLVVDKEFISSWDQFTHCYLLKKVKKQKRIKNRLSPKTAIKLRRSIVDKYRLLDDQLLNKLINFKGNVYLFGAGEFSQIIRCYAPKFFDRLSSLVVSDKKGARLFNKQIRLIREIKPNSGVIVIGVRKDMADKILTNLLKLGWSKEKIIKIN
jgi:2-polyprenyl-3-methyl-5-hydroxy-6-metoxy-1,4-benzoquinol methylase